MLGAGAAVQAVVPQSLSEDLFRTGTARGLRFACVRVVSKAKHRSGARASKTVSRVASGGEIACHGSLRRCLSKKTDGIRYGIDQLLGVGGGVGRRRQG